MIHETISLSSPKADGFVPTLTTYILDETVYPENPRRRPAVIILPGSGYVKCCPREGEPVAVMYNAAGYHAFVLYYSCAPNVFPAALKELSDAVKLVRKNAEKWNIDPNKIAVCGFSAGGHLAASLGTLWNKEEAIKCENEENRPNALILGYPVITSEKDAANIDSFISLLGDKKDDEKMLSYLSLENQVSKDTPPAFIFHTLNDTCVPAENSLMFAEALKKHSIPFELHIFPNGPHGLATATLETYNTDEYIQVSAWTKLSVRWLDYIFDKDKFLRNK